MNFKKSYDSGTLKSKFSTRNASLACSGSLFLKLSSNWGGFSNLIKMLQYAAVSALGSCHQNFFESSTDQAREPKTAVKVLEVRIPVVEALPEDIWAMLLKTMKERLPAVETQGQAGPLEGDGLVNSQPMGHSHAGGSTSSLAAPSLLPTHTCRTDSSKAALPAVCRAWTSSENLLLAGQFSHTWWIYTIAPPCIFLDRNTSSIHALLADL